MGYLTTFTVYNDGCDQIKKHPKKFAEIIYDACAGIQLHTGQKQVGLGNDANLITLQKPRSAEHHTLYLHAGNLLTDVYDIDENSWALDTMIDELEWQLRRLKAIKRNVKK